MGEIFEANVTGVENSLTDVTKALLTGQSQISSPDTLALNNRFSAITINRSLVTALYQEHGIVQTFIDIPVDDAYRGGISIKCDQLDAEDLKKLNTFVTKSNLIGTYRAARKWARLYGGGAVMINAGQDLSKPFNVDRIKEDTPLAFYDVDRWELAYNPTGNPLDKFDDHFSEIPYNYYGTPVHKSQIVKLDGMQAPSLIRGMFSGWGVSILEKIVRNFNMYLKHQNVVFEILDETKIDVFKFRDLNSSLLSKEGTKKTQDRVYLASQLKSFLNALVIDIEDDYAQKQLSFSGLSDVMTEIRKGLASDLRMPMSKLFGLSSAGLGSGEDDIENYNAMIETDIRSKDRGGLEYLLGVCCQKLFGFVPDNLTFEYGTLRVMTPDQESRSVLEKLDRILTILDRGLIPSEKAIELINIEKIFPIVLDSNVALSLEELAEIRESWKAKGGIGGEDLKRYRK